MRILLATAVAIAPLLTASGAVAEVVISTARTTPIATSTATGTGPDSIRIATGGAINLTSGVAVTVDSSHGFEMASGGNISFTNAASGSTGVLLNGGNTSNSTIAGQITITDDLANDIDNDNDGDIDGPWASGSNRYGVRVTNGTLTGNLNLEPSSTITVEGNNSAGVLVESTLNGRLQALGTVNVRGDNSIGIRTTGNVTGDANIGGTINSRGAGSSAISIEGDVGGRLAIQSTVTSSGFRYTSALPERPEGYTENAAQNKAIVFRDELDPDDLLIGGPAVRVAGNVARGLIFDTAPGYSAAGIDGDDDGDGIKNGDEDDDGDGVPNRTDTDRDGDGIPDVSEGTAAITSYGTAAAVEVGSSTRSITLGEAGTGNNAYGFINRGSLTGLGVFDGFDAQAVVIGGNAGQTVTIAGGIRNEGTIAALAIEADATAVRIGSGTITPTMINTGNITAGVSSPDTIDQATAIRIEAGANMPSFVNNGGILASAGGSASNTTALIDLSGSLTSITNTRSIQSNITPSEGDTTVTGRAVAIDVSANTTGVTLLQNGIASTPSATDPDSDGDGVVDSREPQIIGEIRFGSGADVMDIRNGTVIGDMSFGAGADRLDISGGAVVRGAVNDSDGNLTVNISNGVLDARQSGPQTITDLNIGANGDLIVTVDPVSGTTSGFNVTGTANLASGAGLGVRFNSLIQNETRFTLIDANTLTIGTLDLNSFQENSPYLFVVQGGADVANGTIFADVRRRTAGEAALISSEASMYDAFYSALERDTEVRNAFLNQLSRDDFLNLYEQLLPEHSGGPLLSLASGVDAVTRALTGRNASAAPGETSAWVQEINFYADKDKTDTYGFRSEGFGVAGGVERGTELGALGLSVAFTSSDLEDPESEAEEVLSANLLELGLYWRAQGQRWTTWARAAGGYATFESERRLVAEGINRTALSDWKGFTISAAGGVSYEQTFGRFSIRPELYAEYFSLSEEGHSETGGGDGFDLDIDDRDGHLFAATAAINLGMSMGQDDWLRPELRIGWRQNISVDPGETLARFRSGGPDFRLTPDTIEGGGPIVGFRMNVGNELGMLTVSADAELLEDYVRYMLFLRASFRF